MKKYEEPKLEVIEIEDIVTSDTLNSTGNVPTFPD